MGRHFLYGCTGQEVADRPAGYAASSWPGFKAVTPFEELLQPLHETCRRGTSVGNAAIEQDRCIGIRGRPAYGLVRNSSITDLNCSRSSMNG
jgi:hypothetical protein